MEIKEQIKSLKLVLDNPANQLNQTSIDLIDTIIINLELQLKNKCVDHGILRNMVELSNNSPLTQSAALVISSVEIEKRACIKTWLEHAKREQGIKINTSKRIRF